MYPKARKAASPLAPRIGRRAVLKAGLAWTASAIAAPVSIRAREDLPVKIGMVEPLTGVFAQLAEAEVAGARLAIEQINHSRGILGREAQLLVADSANEISTGVEQTRRLIDKDQVDFIAGNVNSAVALAMTRVTAEKRKLQIVTGGHTDEITGSQCSWNVFRVCKSTTMEANVIAEVLIEKFGARWYFWRRFRETMERVGNFVVSAMPSVGPLHRSAKVCCGSGSFLAAHESVRR